MQQIFYPPTPTPLPTVSPEELGITIPQEALNLWNYAPDAIQAWNTAGQAAFIFQSIILVGMIWGLVMVIWFRVQASLEEKN